MTAQYDTKISQMFTAHNLFKHRLCAVFKDIVFSPGHGNSIVLLHNVYISLFNCQETDYVSMCEMYHTELHVRM